MPRIEFIENIFAASANASTDTSDWSTDIPADQQCSSCIVGLLQHIQSTSYSNYDVNIAAEWASIQSQCNLSFSTAVPSLHTNVTQPGGFAVPGTAKTGCLSGITYNVLGGDNCEEICERKTCSTGTLIAINDIYSDCSNLVVGAVSIVSPSNAYL